MCWYNASRNNHVQGSFTTGALQMFSCSCLLSSFSLWRSCSGYLYICMWPLQNNGCWWSWLPQSVLSPTCVSQCKVQWKSPSSTPLSVTQTQNPKLIMQNPWCKMCMVDRVSLQLPKRELEFCDEMSDTAVVTGNADFMRFISVFLE